VRKEGVNGVNGDLHHQRNGVTIGLAALSSWTVEQLKEYLRDNNLPLSGNKG
jgi:3'-phosphoadenosine 5'-phosphosulfate sulfotransferase (PAPS reductase)/FAD synthetase